jgi:hypothetical protein
MAKKSKNPNDNCLAGKRCPKCGSYGPFEVVATNWVSVHDEGTDVPIDKCKGDTEYDDDSAAECPAEGCDFSGTWKDLDDPTEKET